MNAAGGQAQPEPGDRDQQPAADQRAGAERGRAGHGAPAGHERHPAGRHRDHHVVGAAAVPLRLAGQRVAQRGVEPAQHELQLVGVEHLRQHPLADLAEPELQVVRLSRTDSACSGGVELLRQGLELARRGPCRCGRRSPPAARRCRCAAGRSPRPGRAGSRCSAPATTAATRCACGRPARPVRRGPGPRRPGPGRWPSSGRRSARSRRISSLRTARSTLAWRSR